MRELYREIECITCRDLAICIGDYVGKPFLYYVYNEYGEYEDYEHTSHGIFSTLDQAIKSVLQMCRFASSKLLCLIQECRVDSIFGDDQEIYYQVVGNSIVRYEADYLRSGNFNLLYLAMKKYRTAKSINAGGTKIIPDHLFDGSQYPIKLWRTEILKELLEDCDDKYVVKTLENFDDTGENGIMTNEVYLNYFY